MARVILRVHAEGGVARRKIETQEEKLVPMQDIRTPKRPVENEVLLDVPSSIRSVVGQIDRSVGRLFFPFRERKTWTLRNSFDVSSTMMKSFPRLTTPKGHKDSPRRPDASQATMHHII